MLSQELTIRDNVTLSAFPREQDLNSLQRLGSILAASGYFADARDMAQAAVKVMAGQELGVPPLASMMGINIIKGKVALGAHLIASQIRRNGYDFRFKRHDNTGCVLEFLSKPDDKGKRAALGESSFTEEDAKAAGCFSEMYKKYPRNMYYSRAVSNGAKWYTPEIFGGAPVYTPEELGAQVDSEGEMIHPEPPPAGRSARSGTEKLKAENNVRDWKLDEVKKDESAKPQTAATPAPAHAATAAQQEIVPPGVSEMWGRMSNMKGLLAEFGDLKKGVLEVSGGDLEYYRILSRHGAAHANDFKKMGAARACAREMFEWIARASTAQQEPAPAVDDREDWVPDIIGDPAGAETAA